MKVDTHSKYVLAGRKERKEGHKDRTHYIVSQTPGRTRATYSER